MASSPVLKSDNSANSSGKSERYEKEEETSKPEAKSSKRTRREKTEFSRVGWLRHACGASEIAIFSVFGHVEFAHERGRHSGCPISCWRLKNEKGDICIIETDYRIDPMYRESNSCDWLIGTPSHGKQLFWREISMLPVVFDWKVCEMLSAEPDAWFLYLDLGQHQVDSPRLGHS